MIVEFVAEVFSFSIDAKTTNSVIFMLIVLLKMSESFKRVEFDTKHINHWSLDKITQKNHEIFDIVVCDEELNEIASK